MSIDKDRILTAIVLLGTVFIVAFIDTLFLTWLFLGIIFMFAFYEAMRLFKIEDNSLYFYALILWLISYFYPNPDDLIFLILIIFASVMAYHGKAHFKKIYAFIYPTSSFLFLLALYKDFGIESLIWLVLVVALTDTGAYFTGKTIGKTKFCSTSPNKTIEGVIGGVLIATILGSIYGTTFVSIWLSIFISFIVALSSVFGDLFESFLKRLAGVKDSGNILPGHGGVLDRVDGYMFGAILMAVLLRGFA